MKTIEAINCFIKKIESDRAMKTGHIGTIFVSSEIKKQLLEEGAEDFLVMRFNEFTKPVKIIEISSWKDNEISLGFDCGEYVQLYKNKD